MTTDPQTYCDICDRDAVGTWQGVCADCWRESLESGAPNAEWRASGTLSAAWRRFARAVGEEVPRCWIYGYQHDPLAPTPCVHCGAEYPETHFDAAQDLAREEG